EAELAQQTVALRHPVPRGVRHQTRQDDRAEPLGHHVAEQPAERRHEHDEYEQEAELDAGVERQDRGQPMRAGELLHRPQREREAEAVDEAEGERDQPSALQLRGPEHAATHGWGEGPTRYAWGRGPARFNKDEYVLERE